MTARDRWIELAEFTEKQSRKSFEMAADARSIRERRGLRYRGRMYARLATYIRQHPELPAVPPENTEVKWQ